jgi:uncharacterized protein DUF4397
VKHSYVFGRRSSLALVLAVSATACMADEPDTTIINNNGSTGAETTPTSAYVRVVHASPDAPDVDVWAAGVDQPVITGLHYGDTSDYLELPPGSYNIQLRAAGSSASDPIAYETGPIDLAAGRITAVAAGLLGSTESASRFRVLTFAEGFGPAGTGSAVARVVHASPDAPTVAIDLHDDDAGSPEVSSLDRFAATDAAGIVLTSGEKLQIGIVAGGKRLTAFTTPELPEGADLFVIATGLAAESAKAENGFTLLAVGPDGTIGFVKQNPLVYALHAGPNAPAVDVRAGEAQLISNLAFGNLAGPLQVPPGDYTLDFYAAGSNGSPAASAATGMLEPGESYLTIATGLLGSGTNPFQLVSLAEGFDATNPDDTRLRVVHGSPDAPAVDVGILNAEHVVNPVLVPGVAFGGASDAAGLPAGIGTLPVGVAPAGQPATVVASFHVSTLAGQRAFAIAAGALDPMNGQSFRLLVVDTSTSPWSAGTIFPQP